jgi:hypothetical protein
VVAVFLSASGCQKKFQEKSCGVRLEIKIIRRIISVYDAVKNFLYFLKKIKQVVKNKIFFLLPQVFLEKEIKNLLIFFLLI